MDPDKKQLRMLKHEIKQAGNIRPRASRDG